MLALTSRTMLWRARRLLLSVLITSAGVAVIAGTLVFTDTIDAAVHRVFSDASAGADVVVAARESIASDPSAGPSVPQSALGRIRRLPGVVAVAGQVSEVATIVGRDGRPLSAGRMPTLAVSYVGSPFRGIRLVKGRAPRGAGQVAIDAATAAREGLTVGDTVSVVTGQPQRPFRISGIASIGGGQVNGQRLVVFGTRAAQSLFGLTDAYDRVLVATAAGASAVRIADRIQRLLPAGLVARTRAADASAQAQRAEQRLRSLTTGLVAFSLIAILVGALLVWGSFAATGTRRAGELALLRVLGATRWQVVRSVLLEAGAVGMLATALGLALGPVVAVLVRALFDRAGTGMPSGTMVLHARTAWVGAGVGIGVALAAGVWPALRASRAAPLEALRAAAPAPQRLRGELARAVIGVALGIGGIALILTAGGAAGERLRISAIGGAVVLLATLVVAPLFVPVMARPVAWMLGRRNEVAAGLAREQVRQNPARTAISASSLTIGLALVLLVTVYAGALRAAGRDAVRQTFVGDAAIQDVDGVTPIPASSVQAAALAPGVLGVSALRTARADLGAAQAMNVSGIDPVSWPLVYRFDWIQGSRQSLARLGAGGVLLEQDAARAAHLSLGQRTFLRTGSGTKVPVRVAGIFRDAGLLQGAVLTAPWFAQLFNQPRLQSVFVKLAPGPGRAPALAALRSAIGRFPGLVVRSESALADKAQGTVTGVVGLFYALLVLSLVMSLIGITGTLSLSIHERTRELGLLRAVGMSAAQARALVRDESLIAAGVGGVTGVALGLLLGWAVTRALAPDGLVFTMPWLGLAAVVAVGVAAGVLASMPPARTVTRLDVLAAIAHE